MSDQPTRTTTGPIRVWIDPTAKIGEVCRIEVYADAKRRYYNRGTAEPIPDRWVLYRRDVPSLTAEEWAARPSGDGWELGS